ncbi:D-alanyl-D-alanine carboxypeptidase [Pararhodonellum marinum]|uniref:D-alanyl-D-alanine carboxypeptidase n=1 Tax=Pararhodonellum marinum TaxID=2755358 RepID=UPI0018900F5E|nr:D-alanyl-D-alanine carboxypeptidase [Pararhodonellum marinum]
MKKIWIVVLLLSFSCTLKKIERSVHDSEVFNKGHVGFMLYDPSEQKVLASLNEDRYFIPASNTKLFTFYTSYKILGDSLANGLNYLISGDSLVFWGTGDPSFLHPDFEQSFIPGFLKGVQKDLYYASNSQQVKPFGPGWSWDWYNYYFATQRSAFPIYGNVVRVSKKAESKTLDIHPEYFSDAVFEIDPLEKGRYELVRNQNENIFTYAYNPEVDSLSFETDKPFVTSDNLLIELLSDHLYRDVEVVDYQKFKDRPHDKLPSVPLDTLYARMMKSSDNFLAEQLLLQVSDQMFDSLSTEAVIRYAKTNLLNDLPDEPIWMDGSGLSARNMFTPRSVIALLKKIHQEVPFEKIKAYFPAGGASGTIRNWYPGDGGVPYIYAKTGTLSMSNCLSGYLLTKKGKVFYFSFMLNNFTVPSDELKKEMQTVLYQIHQKF